MATPAETTRQTDDRIAQTREAARERMREYAHSSRDIFPGALQRFRALPEDQRIAHTHDVLGAKRLSYIAAVQDMNRAQIDGPRSIKKDAAGNDEAPTTIRGRMLSSSVFKHAQDAKKLETVLDALTMAPPAPGDAPGRPLNLFLYRDTYGRDEDSKTMRYIYKLDFTRLTQEYKDLERLALTSKDPQFIADAKIVLECLNRLASTAPNELAEYQVGRAVADGNANRPARQAMNHMARIGATVVFGTAAAVFGGISIATGNPSVAPVWYGLMAYAAANPGTLKGILSPEDYRIVREAGDIANDPWMRALCRKYGVKGPAWANTLDTIATMPAAERGKLLKAIDALNGQGLTVRQKEDEILAKPAYQAIRDFLAAHPEPQRTALRAMIVSGNGGVPSQFHGLTERLKPAAHNAKVREFLLELVRNGKM